jgi:hypothetical protein
MADRGQEFVCRDEEDMKIEEEQCNMSSKTLGLTSEDSYSMSENNEKKIKRTNCYFFGLVILEHLQELCI